MNIRVRSMKASDVSFVQELSALQKNFSVPPADLLHFGIIGGFPDGNLVAVDQHGDRLGYLTSLIMSNRRGVFVWQIAVTHKGSRLGAARAMLGKLNTVIRNGKYSHVRRIYFTMFPRVEKSWGRKVAKRVFGAYPRHCRNHKPVPGGERLYAVDISSPRTTS